MSRTNLCDDGNDQAALERLLTRLLDQKAHVQAFRNWLKDRSFLDEEYAQKLLKLSRTLPSSMRGHGTLHNAWRSYCVCTEQSARAVHNRARAIYSIHSQYELICLDYFNMRKRLFNDLQKLDLDLHSARLKLEKLTEDVYIARQTNAESQEKLIEVKRDSVKLKEIEKAQNNALRNARIMKKTQQRQSTAATNYQGLILKRQVLIKQTMQTLQSLEMSRVIFLRRMLWLVANVDSDSSVQIDKIQNNFRSTLLNIDVDSEVELDAKNDDTYHRYQKMSDSKKDKRFSLFDPIISTFQSAARSNSSSSKKRLAYKNQSPALSLRIDSTPNNSWTQQNKRNRPLISQAFFNRQSTFSLADKSMHSSNDDLNTMACKLSSGNEIHRHQVKFRNRQSSSEDQQRPAEMTSENSESPIGRCESDLKRRGALRLKKRTNISEPLKRMKVKDISDANQDTVKSLPAETTKGSQYKFLNRADSERLNGDEVKYRPQWSSSFSLDGNQQRSSIFHDMQSIKDNDSSSEI